MMRINTGLAGARTAGTVFREMIAMITGGHRGTPATLLPCAGKPTVILGSVKSERVLSLGIA